MASVEAHTALKQQISMRKVSAQTEQKPFFGFIRFSPATAGKFLQEKAEQNREEKADAQLHRQPGHKTQYQHVS